MEAPLECVSAPPPRPPGPRGDEPGSPSGSGLSGPWSGAERLLERGAGSRMGGAEAERGAGLGPSVGRGRAWGGAERGAGLTFAGLAVRRQLVARMALAVRDAPECAARVHAAAVVVCARVSPCAHRAEEWRQRGEVRVGGWSSGRFRVLGSGPGVRPHLALSTLLLQSDLGGSGLRPPRCGGPRDTPEKAAESKPALPPPPGPLSLLEPCAQQLLQPQDPAPLCTHCWPGASGLSTLDPRGLPGGWRALSQHPPRPSSSFPDLKETPEPAPFLHQKSPLLPGQAA